jgi:hypothetical protein
LAVIITTFFLKNYQNPGNPLVWRAMLFLKCKHEIQGNVLNEIQKPGGISTTT